MTCTVSRPDSSSKNQPQLVYISIKCLCVSSSFSVVTCSSALNAWLACSAKKASTLASERFRITRIYASLADHGSLSNGLPRSSNTGFSLSRKKSSAARNGPRHSWFQSPCPPELQPQFERQRSTPCTQLHELFSTIS